MTGIENKALTATHEASSGPTEDLKKIAVGASKDMRKGVLNSISPNPEAKNTQSETPEAGHCSEFRNRVFELLTLFGETGENLMKKLEENGSLTKRDIVQLRQTYPERYEMITEAIATREKIINNLDSYLENSPLIMETDERSALQYRALTKLSEFLKEGGSKGYFWYPTATGKTRILSLIADKCGQNSLILTPSLKINSQTEKRFTTSPDHKDLSPEDIFIHDSDHVAVDETNARIQVSTYDSTDKAFSRNKKTPEFFLLDELHRSFTESITELIRQNIEKKGMEFKDKTEYDDFLKAMLKIVPQIGFSATPFIGNKRAEKLGFKMIDGSSTLDCIEANLLPSTHLISKTIKTNGVVRAIDSREGMMIDIEEDKNILQSAYLADYTGLTEKISKKEGSERYPQSIFISSTVAEAESSANKTCRVYQPELFVNNNVSEITTVSQLENFITENDEAPFAFPLSGDSDSKLRDKVYELYDQGEIKVLCGADIFNEGVDLPNAEAVFLPPGESWNDLIQRMGRVLRKNPDNPDKDAYIYSYFPKDGKKYVDPENAIAMTYMDAETKQKLKEEPIAKTIEIHRQRAEMANNPTKNELKITSDDIPTEPKMSKAFIDDEKLTPEEAIFNEVRQNIDSFKIEYKNNNPNVDKKYRVILHLKNKDDISPTITEVFFDNIYALIERRPHLSKQILETLRFGKKNLWELVNKVYKLNNENLDLVALKNKKKNPSKHADELANLKKNLDFIFSQSNL